jgi:hypothetical protein
MAFILDSLLKYDATTSRLLGCELQSLRAAGVDDVELLELQRLIDSGHDEYQVVLALLVAVVRMRSGPRLARNTIRAIEKAARTLTLDQTVADLITIFTAQRFAQSAAAHP